MSKGLNSKYTWVCFLSLLISASVSTAYTERMAEAASNAGLTVVGRGPDERVWAHVTYSTNGDDTITATTNAAFTEVATGLHYWNSAEWSESEDRIDLTEDGGAQAVRGPIKLLLGSNLNGSEYPITLISGTGRPLETRPLGLFYHDTASGEVVELGKVIDSRGELLPPNQLIWRSALKGVQADFRITYTKAGIASDMILLERPRSPEAYGLDPRTTRLEVWHRWRGSTPKQRIIHVNRQGKGSFDEDGLVADTLLDFGDLFFPHGRAFLTEPTEPRKETEPARVRLSSPDDPNSLPVSKEWVGGLEDISVLVESVYWADVEGQLASLPEVAAFESLPQVQNRTFALAAITREEPSSAALNEKPIEMASNSYARRGLVIDYDVFSASSYTFEPARTYYVYQASFTTATFNGGVIKYDASGFIAVFGNVTFPGGPVFTSKDDDLHGTILPDSTHTPTYTARPALWLYYLDVPAVNISSSPTFRWAITGLQHNIDPLIPSTCNLSFTRFEMCNAAVAGTNIVVGSFVKYCGVDMNTAGMINDCSGDSDGDGLTDLWECKHFANKEGAQANGDPDCDGWPNWMEQGYQTNPRDRNVVITTQTSPSEQVVVQGANVTFTVAANPPLRRYQWYRNGEAVAGATGSSVNFANVGLNFYNSSIYVKVSTDVMSVDSAVAKLYVLSPFWKGVHDTFVAAAPGKTIQVRGTHVHPPGWPNVRPQLEWDTTGLLYGKTGVTAISLCNSFGCIGGVTQTPVTALTPRHGYIRGHGTGPCPCGTNDSAWTGTSGWKGRKIWFKYLTGTVEEAVVEAAYISNPESCCPGQPDHTILIFKNPLPSSVEKMRVMTLPAGRQPINPYHLRIRTCQHMFLNANYSGFDSHFSEEGGDSGSPNMLLIPGGELVFYSGTDTSEISQTMQNHMDALSHTWGEGSLYQLNCFSPCGYTCFSACPETQ